MGNAYMAADLRVPTLMDVWLDYKRTRKLKPATEADYIKRLRQLSDWWETPINEISKGLICDRHQTLTERSPSHANLVFKVLRALMTYAEIKYEDREGAPLLKSNPVKSLSSLRAWNKIKRRKTIIGKHQMKAWFEAVYSLENVVVRDFLLTLLLTGLRRQEAALLTWDRIDLIGRRILIPDTKNGDDHELPIPNYLYRVLSERNLGKRSSNPYVFPGRVAGKSLCNSNKSYQHVIERSGVQFCLHDLRRGFATTARSAGIDKDYIKRLLNHKSQDVTDGYIIMSVEDLRKPMQLIEDCILEAAGLGF